MQGSAREQSDLWLQAQVAGGVDTSHQCHSGPDLLQRAAHSPGEEDQWPAATFIWLHHHRYHLLMSVSVSQKQQLYRATLFFFNRPNKDICQYLCVIDMTYWFEIKDKVDSWLLCRAFQSLPPISCWGLSRFQWKRSPLVMSSTSCLLSRLLAHATSWNGIMWRWPLERMTQFKVSVKSN